MIRYHQNNFNEVEFAKKIVQALDQLPIQKKFLVGLEQARIQAIKRAIFIKKSTKKNREKAFPSLANALVYQLKQVANSVDVKNFIPTIPEGFRIMDNNPASL